MGINGGEKESSMPFALSQHGSQPATWQGGELWGKDRGTQKNRDSKGNITVSLVVQ